MPSRNPAADTILIYMGWLPFHMIVAVACEWMSAISASHKAGGGRKEVAFLPSVLCAIGKNVPGKNHPTVLSMPFKQHLKTQYTFAVIYTVYHNERIYLQNREKKYPFFSLFSWAINCHLEAGVRKCSKIGNDNRQAQEEKLFAPSSPLLPDWVPCPGEVQSVLELWDPTRLSYGKFFL